MIEIVKLVADVGGSLGLALFAIWMLDRAYRQHEKRVEEDRQELVSALERNTAAWSETATTIAVLGTGIEGLGQTSQGNSETLARLTAIMARRPCVGGEVVGGE